MKRKNYVKKPRQNKVILLTVFGVVGCFVVAGSLYYLFREKEPESFSQQGGVYSSGTTSGVVLADGDSADKGSIKDGITYTAAPTATPQVEDKEGDSSDTKGEQQTGSLEQTEGLEQTGNSFIEGLSVEVDDKNPDKAGETLVDSVTKEEKPEPDDSEKDYISDETRNYPLTTDPIFQTITKNEEVKEMLGDVALVNQLDFARGFFKEFFTISYKDIDTKEKYEAVKWKLCKYLHPEDIWLDNSAKQLSSEELVMKWLDIIKETKTEMAARFYTDSKLIYGNPCSFIRGELEFTIKACTDTKKLVEFTDLITSGNGKPAAVGQAYHGGVEMQLGNYSVSASSKWIPDEVVDSYYYLGDVKKGGIK